MSLRAYHDYIATLIPQQYQDYIDTYSLRLPKTVSIMTQRCGVQDFMDTTDIFVMRDNHSSSHAMTDRLRLWDYWRHEAWRCYVQETAASLPVTYMPLQCGDIVLDMCASPWGKTSQIADRLRELWWWYVVAHEIDRSRRDGLFDNLTRIWSPNIVITWKLWTAKFDHILVDAPCTGEGTCNRTLDHMHERSLTKVHKTAQLQYEILCQAAHLLKPWGTLTYSTCTLNEYENERVVQRFRDSHGRDIIPVAYWSHTWLLLQWVDTDMSTSTIRCFPQQWLGWFFIAQFRKPGILSQNVYTPKPHRVKDRLYDTFGISLSVYEDILTIDDLHYLIGWNNQYKPAQIWLPIAKWDTRSIRPLHRLGSALGTRAQHHIHEVDPEFITQRALHIPCDWSDFGIARYRWYWLTAGKIIDGDLKVRRRKM